MSRQQKKRRNRDAAPNRPETIKGSGPSWGLTILVLLGALGLGAVYYLQLTSRTSFYSALNLVEFVDLRDGRPVQTKSGRTTRRLSDVYRAYEAELQPNGRPVAEMRAVIAVNALLDLVVELDRGRSSTEGGLTRVRERLQQFVGSDAAKSANDPVGQLVTNALAVDPNNRVSRLAGAVIAEMRDASGATTKSAASARFHRCRDIVEQPSGPPSSRLYNRELTRLWHRVLGRYIERPGLAEAYAVTLQHFPISLENRFEFLEIHHAAFGVIQDTLAELERDLISDGQAGEAAACRRWLGQMLLGVLSNERDASTRLLCADKLVECIKPGSKAAEDLRSLRQAFHDHCADAMIDRTDLLQHAPAVDPDGYRRTFARLIASASLAATAGGGVVACVLAMVCGLISRRLRAAESESPSGRTWLYAGLVALGIAAAVSGAQTVVASRRGIPSVYWAWTSTGIAIMTGAALAGIVAVLAARRAGRGLAFPAVALAVIAGAAALTPHRIASVIRAIDPLIDPRWAVIGLTCLAVVVSIVLCPVPIRFVARGGAIVGLVCAVASLATYQLHRHADRRYQQTVISGRLDEFSARLGADWEKRYLANVRAELTAPQ